MMKTELGRRVDRRFTPHVTLLYDQEKDCVPARGVTDQRGHHDLRRAGIVQLAMMGKLTSGLSLSPATDSRLRYRER
jgi:hypothetical protein